MGCVVSIPAGLYIHLIWYVCLFVPDRNRESFPISSFLSISFGLFDSNKDMCIDSNQMCNLIRIRWDNPKNIVVVWIALSMYALFPILWEGSLFILIRKPTVSGLSDFTPLRPTNLGGCRSHWTPRDHDRFPDTGTCHLHKVKSFSYLFSVRLTIPLPYQAQNYLYHREIQSARLHHQGQVAIFNAFTNATAYCTSGSDPQYNRTHCNILLQSTSQFEQDKLKQFQHKILWRCSWNLNPTKCLIGPIRSRPFYIQASWLAISGKLSPRPWSTPIRPIGSKSFF